MKDISDLFWGATIEELKQGYIYNETSKKYTCLICGRCFDKGIIYQQDDLLYEAVKFVEVHMIKEHKSMFDYLLNLDKRVTGLTDHQRNLMGHFYRGYSDNDIVKALDGGSPSTIRNHRFTLREKEKQAKVFLAIMGLLESGVSEEAKSIKKQNFMNIHRSATMIDERYAITEAENEKILSSYFKEGLDGPLSEFPTREKRKLVVLKHIIRLFEPNTKYTEKEVNEKLKAVYPDYVTIRRYMIEYGFLDRHKDGSSYWVKV